MAVGTPLVTIAAAAAAIGALCGYEVHHHHNNNINTWKHHNKNEGERKERAREAYVGEGDKQLLEPKFAPEFDGLHCYETLIKH